VIHPVNGHVSKIGGLATLSRELAAGRH
jgi:hypothetical protein